MPPETAQGAGVPTLPAVSVRQEEAGARADEALVQQAAEAVARDLRRSAVGGAALPLDAVYGRDRMPSISASPFVVVLRIYCTVGAPA